MSNDLLKWLSGELYMVMATPIENDQRLVASRELVEIFVDRVNDLSSEERAQILEVLDRWIVTGQVDDYTIPTDNETFSWMEGIVGTLIGMLET